MTIEMPLPEPLSIAISKILKIDNAVHEIWLFGSRANQTESISSDWDIIVFADQSFYAKLRCSQKNIQNNLDILVTSDRINAKQPWMSKSKDGYLRRKMMYIGKWKFNTSTEAIYTKLDHQRQSENFGPDPYINCNAYQIFPKISEVYKTILIIQ